VSHEVRRLPGGVHPPGFKELSNREPIARATLPELLVLPLQQHIGEPAEPVVKVGERVLKGQVLARASGYVSVPVHASTSGRVVAIEDRPVPHPSGLSAPCVVLEPDGDDAWTELAPTPDYASVDPSHLRNLVREAGIVGMGGAGFPTFIKLNPGPKRKVHTVILNGVECEPYITCDDRLMRERADAVVAGGCIVRHAVQAERCVLAVEDNKPEAAEALRRAATDGVEVLVVPTVYPSGGEKQIIQVVTGKEVPSGRLPVEIGVVVQNVATAAALHVAVSRGEPLVSRLVTVTGNGVGRPRNLEVALGTPVAHLLGEAEPSPVQARALIMGGPMMGFALHDEQAPTVKTTNCVLVDVPQGVAEPPMPCIRCGACARACPMHLLPQQLYWFARSRNFDKVQDYNLFDCIECGCCAYVCPSHIPLVHYYRFAKTEVWAQERDRQRADLAKRRHTSRVERLEQEKREREERQHRKKAAAAAAPAEDAGEVKKAAVQAAIQRARARQAARDEPPPAAREEA
jgi:electron transport complex protein RnfC